MMIRIPSRHGPGERTGQLGDVTAFVESVVRIGQKLEVDDGYGP